MNSYPITIGKKPNGAATSTTRHLRWATITNDDGVLNITAYEGWSIVDEVRLHGRTARSMAETIAHDLIAVSA